MTRDRLLWRAVLCAYCNYERAIQVPFPICLDKT
jgi:hypothetical protein